MAKFTSAVKRAFLRKAFLDRSLATENPAPDGTTRTKLEGISYNAIKPTLSGIQFQSVSGNGSTQVFAPGISPQDAAAIAEDLIVLYDQVVAEMPTLTDEPSIFTEMMRRLLPVYSSTTDHSTARIR